MSAEYTNDDMQKRIIRFESMKQGGIPLMFIDSILPGHQRMNYSILGDTASENPDFKVEIPFPHRFQIGMVNAPPKNGPAYHTHDYIEMFLVLSGEWRFYWGNDGEAEPEGEATLGQWDMITLPPGLYRGFENVSGDNSWLFAVLETHEVFTGKDPIWSPRVERAAAEKGFHSNELGKMIKPDNYDELRQQTDAFLRQGLK